MVLRIEHHIEQYMFSIDKNILSSILSSIIKETLDFFDNIIIIYYKVIIGGGRGYENEKQKAV